MRITDPRAIIAFDTGLATFGMAAVDPTGGELLALSFFGSTKSDKKLNVSNSSDITHRGVRLAAAVEAFCTRFEVVAVVHEGLSFPRSARAAALLALSVGVVIARAQLLDAPLLEVSPQDLKVAATGRKNAPKQEVLDGIAQKPGFGNIHDLVAALKINASQVEHPVDAAVAGYWALTHDMIRAFRRAA